MRCPECNSYVEDGSEFCPECGADMPQRKKSLRDHSNPDYTCPQCGAEINSGTESCPDCGSAIRGTEPDPEEW